MAANHSNNRDWGVIIRGVYEFMVVLAVLLLVGLLIYGAWLHIEDLRADDEAAAPTGDINADIQNALDEVDRTTENFNRLLSLLEGAGVLVGLAVGAAAFYGLRNTRETREEFKEISKEAKAQLAQLDDYDEYLKKLPDQAVSVEQLEKNQADTIEQLKQDQADLLEDLQSNFLDLFQAYQELRLKNHHEAYEAVLRVLLRDETNPQALYLAGWLEFQYVPGKLDDGITHLERALEKDKNWPSARAALGVLLRRKGLRASSNNERKKYMAQAEANLREALDRNFGLIDPNMESFWGPLGGALRDGERYDEAIEAYEHACSVTPGSSYPRGNLAALYLKKVQEKQLSAKTALDAFRETRQLAHVELSQIPNDYFLMMDIAMASAVLGHEQAEEFEIAQKWLDRALAIPDVTPELHGVSIRGWGYLRDYCPDDWDPVSDFIYRAIQRLEDEQTARRAEPEQHTPIDG